MENIIKDIYIDVLKNNNGNLANYIPQLAKVNPDLFSISICDIKVRDIIKKKTESGSSI